MPGILLVNFVITQLTQYTLPSRRYKRRKTLSMVKVSRNTDSTCRKLKFTLQMYNCNTQKIKDKEIRKVIQSQVEDGLPGNITIYYP